jgi:hypothetical protein
MHFVQVGAVNVLAQNCVQWQALLLGVLNLWDLLPALLIVVFPHVEYLIIHLKLLWFLRCCHETGELSRYSDWLRAER